MSGFRPLLFVPDIKRLPALLSSPLWEVCVAWNAGRSEPCGLLSAPVCRGREYSRADRIATSQHDEGREREVVTRRFSQRTRERLIPTFFKEATFGVFWTFLDKVLKLKFNLTTILPMLENYCRFYNGIVRQFFLVKISFLFFKIILVSSGYAEHSVDQIYSWS